MTYDPHNRRDTPLAIQLKERISRDGPLSIAQYMQACLFDNQHGYYRTQAAIGAGADFITAPEITQVFGELLGLWSAVVWQQMGAPERVHLIELGPGRGTLVADALRAARILPQYMAAIDVHLVECSAVLRKVQRETLLAGVPDNSPAITWHERLDEIPPGPSIIIANEFFDALPVEQIVKRENMWHRRMVTLDQNNRLCFADMMLGEAETHALYPVGRTAEPTPPDQRLPEGAVKEIADNGDLLHSLVTRAGDAPLAALILDYGYSEAGYGDSLQAVRDHHHEHPLTSPGEADLTCHVDFQALANQATVLSRQMNIGLDIDGPVTQAECLGALGIAQRASMLMAANPDRAGEIESAIMRLMAPQGMGTRFKVLGLRTLGLPPLPGLTALPGND